MHGNAYKRVLKATNMSLLMLLLLNKEVADPVGFWVQSEGGTKGRKRSPGNRVRCQWVAKGASEWKGR